MANKVLSVSELNTYIKTIIDEDVILNCLSVKGEISNLKFHSSGHIYFSIKDNLSKINCVMFKSKAIKLNIKLQDGMKVVIDGSMSLYTATGSIQIYCDSIKEQGKGDLYIKFEELKEKLQMQGFFSAENKKELPLYPKSIGVVTSRTGAVIRDIINVTKRRSSLVNIVLYPANVQGSGAYKDIIQGINYFNQNKNVDIIIIGRGGGSIEELWNFNEEDLAISIYNSEIPIISAVGHETDFTISDFVSDVRASTPSQAAEIAVPIEDDIIDDLNKMHLKLKNNLDNKINDCKNKIYNFERIIKLNSPQKKIQNYIVHLDMINDSFNKTILNRMNFERNKVNNFKLLLEANNPSNILEKGYAIITDNNNNILSKREDILKNDKITIKVSDGCIDGDFIKNEK